MRSISWIVTSCSVIGIPALSLVLIDRSLSDLLSFPPEFGSVEHLPFNLKLNLLVLCGLALLPVIWFLNRSHRWFYRHSIVLQRRSFPRWGYFGYGLFILSWGFAWSRLDWLSSIQVYSFTPLWLGFIVVINAHVHRLSNQSPLKKSPKKFACLFLVSAFFWWAFEYLNRFTENWAYGGVEGVSQLHYYVHGSICFSTVLPAVFSVYRFIYSSNDLHRLFYLGPRLSLLKYRSFGIACLMLGLLSMIGIVVYPQYCYPFLWVGPVLIYGGMQFAVNKYHRMGRWKRGDWRWVAFWATSGLVCGYFWEFWNYLSLLRWEYSVSFFNGLKVFEMPLLGYLGYIPFGVFCGLVTELLFPKQAAVGFSPE